MSTNYVVVNDGTDYGSVQGQMAAIVQGQGGTIAIDVKDLAGNDFPVTGATSIIARMTLHGTSTTTTASGTLSESGGGISWILSSEDAGTDGLFLTIFQFTLSGVVYKTHPVIFPVIEDPAATAVQNSAAATWALTSEANLDAGTADNIASFDAGGVLEDSGYGKANLRKHKFDATAAPGVTDDSDSGYEPGSRWVDVTNDKEYVCLDATVGAAVWTETTASGGGGISNVVEDTTPQLGGDLDAQGNDITDMGDITFKTGAAGGVLRTGTANADKFVLAAYDVNDGVYRTVIELDAGNDVVMQLIADYLAMEDAADTTKHVEWDLSGATGSTATTLIFVQTAARSITFPDETGTLLTDQAIGSTVQAQDAGLADLAGLAVTDGNVIVGDGANWVAESGATARASLGAASLRPTENEQTGTTYTLVLTDEDKIIQTTNGSTVTVTVPPNSSVAFPIGAIVGLEQYGAGTLTVAAGAGVTIRSKDASLSLSGQYAAAALRKIGTDEWWLGGSLA